MWACSTNGGQESPDGGGAELLDGEDGSIADAPVVLRFSFAIITDIHIGEGHLDYGTPGFDDDGGELFPSLVKAPTPSHNPEHGITSYFQNFAFDYEGYHFVALDLNTRAHAPPEYPGIGPEAELHDFEGGTWPFFAQDLAEHADDRDQRLFVFAHHPPLDLELIALTSDEFQTAFDLVVGQGHANRIAGIFGGHWHFDIDEEAGYEGVPVVVTSAAKDDSTVRVIQVFSDDTIDSDILL